MDILRSLFKQHFQSEPDPVTPLQGGLGGSARRIFRLTSGNASAVGILHGVREENAAFLGFTSHFRELGLPVPDIFAEDLPAGAYLMQDLGDTTLYQFLQAHRNGEKLRPAVVDAYSKVIEWLPRFQVEGARGFDDSLCYPRAAFDRQSIQWDLNYFKYYFLRLADLTFSEGELQQDFDRLADFLLLAPSDYFLYRDFQSRNIMLVDGKPWFLDYQGGRRGALQYDIASLLFDAKADLPPAFRAEMLEHYLDALAGHVSISRDGFLRHYYAFVYVRIFQALGAYGFRGYYERKPHFLASIPFALKNLAWLLENVTLPIELPCLLALCQQMLASPALLAISPETLDGQPILHVSITSFSFHRGLPQDSSGHGGGFIFDARSLPNPGREERYKQLSGRSQAVIEYLSREPSVSEFFDHCTALVDASTASYRKRGFEHLSVAFGCTGGQHRSVYLAEKLAAHLRARQGVEVTLHHRELDRMGTA
jgi:aminoglycoside/choline kinase family phosphotransferase